MSKGYGAIALIGGAVGALDNIDGADLVDGDACTVYTDTGVYHYHLNATSGVAENSPYVISPDNNPGDKRWILVTPQGAMSHVRASLSSQAITSGATTQTLIFGETYDTLNEYNPTTGEFTVTNSGYYNINVHVTFNDSSSWDALTYIAMVLLADSSTLQQYRTNPGAADTFRVNLGISGGFWIDAGKVVKTTIQHYASGTRTLESSYLTIDRIV